MAPKGWQKISLHNIATIQTGVAKGKKNIKNPVQLPYLRVANVQDGYLNLSEIKHITVSSSEVDRYLVQPDDVLLTEGGDFDKLGRGHIWEGQISPCLHQNHIFIVRTDPERLLARFFAYLSSSTYGKAYYLSCAKQTTNLASINSTQLREFPVLLPLLWEQQAIVAIISIWDRAIEQMQKLIDAKISLKRGLMQQMLTGKKRFGKYSECKWKEYRLGDLLEEVNRSIPFDDNALYDLISVRRRSGGLFKREPLYGHQILTKNLSIAKHGDFLISRMQIVHGASGLTTAEFDGTKISGSYIALVTKDPRILDIEFFNWLSKTPRLYHIALWASYGVHIEKMTFNLADYFKFKIRVPESLEEQQVIVQALNLCEREILDLQGLITALAFQKKYLIHVLLTGKVRVKPKGE